MTREDFARCIVPLAIALDDELSAERLEALYPAFEDLSREAFAVACKRCMCERKYPKLPPPGELRALATQAVHGIGDTAGDAWERAMSAVRKFSSYRAAEGMAALDPMTRAAVRQSGGWMWLCEVNAENRTTLASQFRRNYEQLASRQETVQTLPEDVRPKIGGANAALLPKLKGIDE